MKPQMEYKQYDPLLMGRHTKIGSGQQSTISHVNICKVSQITELTLTKLYFSSTAKTAENNVFSRSHIYLIVSLQSEVLFYCLKLNTETWRKCWPEKHEAYYYFSVLKTSKVSGFFVYFSFECHSHFSWTGTLR